jgi:hypothetical protein
MNENGSTYSKPDDSRAPSWLGTDTNAQASYLDLRFEDGSVPLNTNVVSANLELYSAADQTNPVTVLIGIENVRSPEEFDTEDPPSTRSLMTKKIAVAITEPWKKNVKYTIPVTELVQLWSQMPNRKKSSRIVLIIKGSDPSASKRFILNGKTKPDHEPRLIVTYQKAGEEPPQPTKLPPRPTDRISPTTSVPNPTTVPSVQPTVKPTTGVGTPVPTAVLPTTVVPTTNNPPPSTKKTGIWISPQEIAALPIGGAGSPYDYVKQSADAGWTRPNIGDQDESTNTQVYAAALMYVKTGNTVYRTKVMNALVQVVGTECMNSTYFISSDKESYKPCPPQTGARSLAIGRKLAAYVIAADLIDLKTYNPTFDTNTFRPWLKYVINRVNEQDSSIISCHNDRPNNWGTHCGATRVAVDIYLGDTADLAKAAAVFKGWVGDRTAYSSFEYKDLSWQADQKNPVGINPVGAKAPNGYSIDGALPDDMRRGCSMTFPPCYTNYPWGALEGATVQAEILSRAGYPAWEWQNKAMRRSVQFLYDLQRNYPAEGGTWWAEGDDTWMIWLVNKTSGSTFPTEQIKRVDHAGKNMSYTDWTHAK